MENVFLFRNMTNTNTNTDSNAIIKNILHILKKKEGISRNQNIVQKNNTVESYDTKTDAIKTEVIKPESIKPVNNKLSIITNTNTNTKIHSKNMNPKDEFRILCQQNINYIRNITIPNIQLDKSYEAVLIEYRKFPHLEFLIRNTILKLGTDWSYTVVCGLDNYEFMTDMCNKIHPNIKIIKTNYTQLNQSTYSLFLASLDFWNLLTGEKILIYQEDSCLFKNNIRQFLKYDYIGAPWPSKQNDNEYGVGNGGFSLRTKQRMIDVINTISIHNTEFNESTIEYMKNANMTVGPEDVYFSLNMIKYKIGNLAKRGDAFNFSTETLVNLNSLGGHNFWLNDALWRKRVGKLAPKFYPRYNKSILTHRGGWKYILDEGLIRNGFYDNQSNIDFYDMIDLDTDKIINSSQKGRKWCGCFHFTPYTPNYLQMCNINNFFSDKNFVHALKNCKFIITLSTYLFNHLKTVFAKLNLSIPMYNLKHPVVMAVPLFDLNKYIDNTNKYIIQIGKQLRKVSSIYLLPEQPSYKKLWLTGSKDYNNCIQHLNDELFYLNIPLSSINLNSVKMYYTSTFEEYDDYLSKNIVFIDVWDAAANNAVLECICRNTPLIVNKVPGVVDYLGENYPLYFNSLSDVPNLLKIVNITRAHKYLKNMNKDDITLDRFVSDLFNIAYKYND
jgi:hypothetical protein